MFILIFNYIGVLMVVVAVVPSIYLFSDSPYVASGILIAFDMAYRIIRKYEGESLLIMLFGPKNGGQFFFLPVWVWGLAVLLTALGNSLFGLGW
jgi:hypothetical protein